MMEKKDWRLLAVIVLVFLAFYFVPHESAWFTTSALSGLSLLSEYAKEHVVTCLVPALFIAGAIAVLIRKDKVLKFLGGNAPKFVSYSVASVSGAILAVCSCTILPLFAGIRKRGAGLGPAITFLFSGPAINIAAVFLTISVLGTGLGIARISAAILISVLSGLVMSLIFREKTEKGALLVEQEKKAVAKWPVAVFFALMIGILVVNGLSLHNRNIVLAVLAAAVILVVIFKFSADIRKAWLQETWSFSKLILPLLFIGVFIAGFVMPLLPEQVITRLVGQNTLLGNVAASVFGAFMYFSTLTEIPILQALISKGMHQGPALALLLAGPSLSLPNMLVIRGVLGTKKTFVYVALVIAFSSIAGLIYGKLI